MRRLMMLGLLLFVTVWGVAAQSAGPRGSDPLPLPPNPEAWLDLSQEELLEILQNPDALGIFFADVVPLLLEDMRAEVAPQLEQFNEELGVAWQTPITRGVLGVLGLLLLVLPHRLNFLGWFFVGIVAGTVVVQTGAANAILQNVFPGEQQLQTGIVGVVIALGLVAMTVGFSLNLVYFLGFVLAGGLAGALIGAQVLNGGILDFTTPVVIVPAVIGSIAMSYAAGRGYTLVAAVLGGIMLAVALGLPLAFGLLLAAISMVVMLARTRYRKAFQRKPIEKLDLEEGRVRLEGQSKPKRPGDPATMKTMHDDSNNSPFKTL
ncbi:MAG: hypothetical protein MUF38_19270 [Anaerolineae bacterium]|nr:hypothetical protein [Anaerolineae bacterium]